MCSGTRLFVGNLPSGVKDLEQGLKEEFSHYGEVKGVELKCKKDVEGREIGQFAFVTIRADNQSVNQCIHEFSEQEWRGAYLNVSIAKESFLERLKREREENEKKKDKQDGPPIPVSNGHIEKINIKIPEKKTASDYEERKEIYSQKISKTPKDEYGPRKSRDFEMETPEQNDVVFDESPAVKKEPKRPKRPKNRVKNIPVEDTTPKEVKKLTPADEKRLKSMQNMRSAYNERKSVLKMALSSVDKKVNKIVFDDDGERVEMKNLNKDVEENGESESRSGKRKSRHYEDEGSNNKKTKAALFDDEEDEEDGGEYNFEVREHFQGEAGQKLLQLQSRYQSDKRFVLDERFMESENTAETKSEPDVRKKQQSDEVEEDETTEMDIEAVGDDEKRKEIEILESILGTSVKTSSRINKDNQQGKKQLPIKTMLRYDPTRPDHDKFMSKPKEKGEETKKSKKEKKEMLEKKAEEEKQKAAPEVSQERYYKVNQSLKQVIQSDDKKTFSLLSMFGTATTEDDSNKINNTDESYRTETIEDNDRVKNPLKESNPFRYDSDTDEEKEKKVSKQAAGAGVDKEATEEAPPTLIDENFFFALDDPRLQEGVKFFLEVKPATERSRVELKNLVKRRIRNNERNERNHHSKVQQNHPQRQQGRHQPTRGRNNFKRR